MSEGLQGKSLPDARDNINFLMGDDHSREGRLLPYPGSSGACCRLPLSPQV